LRGQTVRCSRWLLFFAVAVGAFVVSLGPITDGDIYWHLAAGREIVHERALLRFDSFTLSAAGRLWVDVHWLFQLGAYALYALFGFTGLAIAKAALVAGGATLLVRVAEGSGGALARGVGAVAVLGGLILDRHLVPMRPLIVTLVLLAIFLLALERLRTARARWAWVVLPLAQVVWCNCQGLAPLGPLLVAMYLGGAWLSTRGIRRWPFASEDASALRPLTLLLGLCVLASFITPYGLDAMALPWRLFGRIAQGRANVFASEIAENIPPFVLERTAPALVWHFKWVLALLAAAIALVRPRFHLAHLLAITAFLGLALLANRNLPLFYWVAAPLVAIALAPGASNGLNVGQNRQLASVEKIRLAPRSGERPTREARRVRGSAARQSEPPLSLALSPLRGARESERAGRRNWWISWQSQTVRCSGLRNYCGTAVLVALLGGELVLAGFVQKREPTPGRPTPFHFPVESARRLAGMHASGPVFAADQHGGYLSFAVPSLQPYIDTRLVLHSAQEYADYLALFDDPARFDALDARENFGAVVLTTAYPDRFLGLIWHLASSTSWRLAYTDGYEVLFLRDGPSLALGERATVDAILDELAARFGGHQELHETARLHLARLLVVLGQSRQAEYVLSSLDSRPAAQLRARALFAAGELRAAEALARILLLQDPRDVRSLALLAEIASAANQPGKAGEWLRRALAIDPYDPEARAIAERFRRH
jgi:tetratricopeptide (TPR) repeat protein